MFNILLVDDSAVDRLVIERVLNAHKHFEIDTAEDGVIALEKMQVQVPDLVVTDMQMPNMDGLQLVEKIRAHYPFVPVILVTGEGSEELASLALQRGAAGYVPKSRCDELLRGTIEHVMELTRSESSFKRLIDSTTNCQIEYLIENDVTLISPMLELAQRMCTGMKLCDETGCVQIGVALEHAILNAIFHGNLEIGTESIGNASLIEQRRKESPYMNRRVHVEIRVTRDEAQFLVRDEGRGFNVKDMATSGRKKALTGQAGRGLFLMWAFMDSVTFDSKGNTVVMIKRRVPPSPSSPVVGTKKADLPTLLGIVDPRDDSTPITLATGELRKTVERLAQLTSASSPIQENEKELIELLGAFKDQLATRFEAYDYFEAAVEAAPRVHRESQRLRNEHTELYDRVQKLLETAHDSPACDLESLVKHLQVLLHDLMVLDAAETEMIMNTMFEDIGGGG